MTAETTATASGTHAAGRAQIHNPVLPGFHPDPSILRVGADYYIATSTFGRALFAIRSDEIAAEAMGIDTTRYKVLAFVISAAFAGVAGGLSGQLFANPLSQQNLNFVK